MNGLLHMFRLLFQPCSWCYRYVLLECGGLGNPAAGGKTSGVVSGCADPGRVTLTSGFRVCNLGADSFPFFNLGNFHNFLFSVYKDVFGIKLLNCFLPW